MVPRAVRKSGIVVVVLVVVVVVVIVVGIVKNHSTIIPPHSSSSSNERDHIGFVDQEDHLIGTMTVYEAVLFSALLRLPDEMAIETKVGRVLRVLKELRIQHIADSYIGSVGHR